VFECTDIIGKVFDDRNGNGYQDGVARETGITDQTYYGGKGKGAPVITAPDYEPGLANARLYTVDGTMITTDEYGRFSGDACDTRYGDKDELWCVTVTGCRN